MPPWAKQPITSYCPLSRLPATSVGSKSNGVRHLAQKPLVRPGAPSRERPTADWHTLQYRFSSATTGGFIRLCCGSTSGIGGT